MRTVVSKIFAAFREMQSRPPTAILRFVGAVSGALAVISFLGLPIVKVSVLGLNFTRTGTELIESTLQSNDLSEIAFGVALTLAVIAAGLGSLLFLGNRHKHGPILGGASLSVLIGLGVYLVIREEGTKLIAVGLWLSLVLLAVMSSSTFLTYSYSRTPVVRHDRCGEGSET